MPRRSDPPACGRVFDRIECTEVGEHLCQPRALHAVAFVQECLVHTKGRWARTAFRLAPWQREGIIEPLFGEVRWDPETGGYVRRFRLGWIELARKNGKSELLAAIALYMLVADGEEGAEVYGAAKDREQASKVFDVAERMVLLSPVLSERLTVRRSPRRIVYPAMASYYETLARDALGNLGHNPHCVVFDEVIAQPDDQLWMAMRTGMGARHQPLMVAATTAGNDPSSFAALEHRECVRIADAPERARHRFAYLRNVPNEADPWDESGWHEANPALGDFLSLESLREEAIEARNDPAKENAFRQFRLNQWVAQGTRWMPLHTYDACVGEPWPNPVWRYADWKGRVAWCGLDLSAKHDLSSFCLILPPTGPRGTADAIWRHWAPETALRDLDLATAGQASVWARAGWLTLTDGEVIDYDRVYSDIIADCSHFAVREISYDKWCGEPVRQAIESRCGVQMVSADPTYAGMTQPMTDLMSLTLTRGWAHHGNPVARWCFDSVEVKRSTDNPDLIKPTKPERRAGNKRIDGVIAAALAVGAWRTRGAVPVGIPVRVR